MAVTTHALTRLTTVQTELNLGASDHVTALERMIDAASYAMEQAAGGRHFERTSGIVERVRGTGGLRLILSRTPIVSITSIERLNIDGTVAETYSASTYEIEDANAGFVYRDAGWPWTGAGALDIAGSPLPWTERASLRVTYTAGWITPQQAADSVGTRDLPFDLEEATILATLALYRRRGADRSITNTTTNEASVNYAGAEQGNTLIGSEPNGILPLESLAVAKRYRRIV
jgi:hypothetical protein